MPEGHLIHRIAEDHRRLFRGQKLVVSSPQGRFADQANLLDGSELLDVQAHGKHLFYVWPEEKIVHIHLGLYGKFRLQKTPLPEPRGQIRLRIEGPEQGFDLHGPNQCELIDEFACEEIRSRLGVDPLTRKADPEPAFQKILKSRVAIGTQLMNQSIFAGIGNIYRTEVLFVQRLHPLLPGNSLDVDCLEQIWQTLVHWMHLGVRYRRIITAADRFETSPGRLKRGERTLIYKKPICPDCGVEIDLLTLAGRKVYFCPACQPAH